MTSDNVSHDTMTHEWLSFSENPKRNRIISNVISSSILYSQLVHGGIGRLFSKAAWSSSQRFRFSEDWRKRTTTISKGSAAYQHEPSRSTRSMATPPSSYQQEPARSTRRMATNPSTSQMRPSRSMELAVPRTLKRRPKTKHYCPQQLPKPTVHQRCNDAASSETRGPAPPRGLDRFL